MISNPFVSFSSLYFIVFLVFSFNQLLVVDAQASLGNETDLLSLIAIRGQIEGGVISWNTSFHFCEWDGIICGNRHQRVVALNLSSRGLVGSLSPHIGNLSFLKSIDLSLNKFYGEIPQEIGRLSRLQDIDIFTNNFEGEIPVNLSRCTELTYIRFRLNQLRGNIPAELGHLSKLVNLNLENNNLTGEIPPTFGNLSSADTLSFNYNILEGSLPDTFGGLSELTYLGFANNGFSGEVPLSLYNISSLQIFILGPNKLIGSLPSNMGIALPNLLFFNVGLNEITGNIPVSLTNASSLSGIDLVGNNFTGQVPINLGLQQNLQIIRFGDNQLEDFSFISSLANSSDLTTLSLAQNNFAGPLPDTMANLSLQLQKLELGGNQLSGIIPEWIGNFPNLNILALEDNLFNGNIPSSIGDLQSLQTLSLLGNNLSGLIPNSLGKLSQLSDLDLSFNILQGRIPLSLQDCKNLRSLSLSGNNLNGTIPEEVFSLSSISILLDLSGNSLTGPLPTNVGKLINLGILDVSGNKLSGGLPSGLGDCRVMEELRLENNSFEGVIPESLSSLRGLKYVDMSNNNLSGGLPKFFEDLPLLQGLNLSFNKLEGDVPTKGVFGNASDVSLAGNLKLCGGVHQLQLQKCRIKRGNSNTLKLGIAIAVASIVLLASLVLIMYWRRKPKLKASTSSSVSDQLTKVSYGDLLQATGGFSPTNFIGSGGFGRVYRGILGPEQITVAVKVFNLQLEGVSKSFIAECESLRNIRHRNLVKVLTSCSGTDYEGNDFKALVFEFMPNGSLEQWLHAAADEDVSEVSLNLLQRLNIAIDVALALNYLHHDSHISIVHRDLKPSNVLLDSDMVAHVSDFGLAKLIAGPIENLNGNQSISIGVKGSIGYAAPEYGMGGEASIKGDVYSYGILLLELFTGRRPTDDMPIDGLNLHDYAKNAIPQQVIQIVDPILVSTEDERIRDTEGVNQSDLRKQMLECITEVMRIGVACSIESPTERLDMGDVTRELHSFRDRYLATGRHGETN